MLPFIPELQASQEQGRFPVGIGLCLRDVLSVNCYTSTLVAHMFALHVLIWFEVSVPQINKLDNTFIFVWQLFDFAMTLVLTPEPMSIQHLVSPLLAIDRKLQELFDVIYDLQDMVDDLTDWNAPNAAVPLQHSIRHLRIARAELQILKLRTYCHIIRALHRQYQTHGRPPYLDLEAFA